jgi:hypothetical protein
MPLSRFGIDEMKKPDTSDIHHMQLAQRSLHENLPGGRPADVSESEKTGMQFF